jgi:hypothetical protein
LRVAILNQSSAPADALFKIAEASTLGLRRVAEAHELAASEVQFLPGAASPPPGFAPLIVQDTPAPADAGLLGVHDRTDDGLPIGWAFFRCIPGGILLRDPRGLAGSLAGVVSHEIIEMVGDRSADCYRRVPFVDASSGARYGWVAEEWCDPVQESALAITVSSGDVVDFSNFLTPGWFNAAAKAGPFDAAGILKAPLSLAPGGYAIVGDGSHETDVFGRLVHHAVPQSIWRARMKAAAHLYSRTGRRRLRGSHG